MQLLRCRIAGCRWETRIGYDFCRRCLGSQWHIARPVGDPLPARRPRLHAFRDALRSGLERLDDWEGSDLFSDPIDPDPKPEPELAA